MRKGPSAMKLTDGSDSYLIRIYRYMDAQSRKIVGTAEKTGDKGKQGFTDMDELWDILNARRRGEGRMICTSRPGTEADNNGRKGSGDLTRQQVKNTLISVSYL